MSNKTIQRNREIARRKQKNRCFYCGELFFNGHPTKDCTAEHIVPRSKGGSNSIKNIVASCLACNHEQAEKLGLNEPEHAAENDPWHGVERPRGMEKKITVEEYWNRRYFNTWN